MATKTDTNNNNNNNNSNNAGNTTDRDGAKYKNNILNYYFAEKEKKNDNRGGGLKITNTNNLLIEDNAEDSALLFNDHDYKTLDNLYENSATTEEFYKELRKTNISKQGLNIITDPTKYNTRANMMTPTANKIPPNLPPLLPSSYAALELEMSENPFVDQSMMSTSSKVNMPHGPASSYNPALDDLSIAKSFDGKISK